MRIPIRLGGHTVPWRFPGADRLGEWVDERPWNERSEVRVIRVADTRSAPQLFEAIQSAVLGADQGAAGVRCHSLAPEQVGDGGLTKALALRLGLTATEDRYTLHAALARRLASQPVVCMVGPLPSEQPAVLADAIDSVDLLGKLAPGVRVCALFADTPERPLTGSAFDLTVGAPASGLEFLTQPRDRLWGEYLHIRIAWDAAGNLARAQDLAGDILRSLSPEDDIGLERGLNRHAEEGFSLLSAAVRDSLIHQLPNPATPRTPEPAPAVASLRATGLLWTLGQADESIPCPWVARALLLSLLRSPNRELMSAREYLRGCVTCAPLARELFTACLQLEIQERGRLIDPSQSPQKQDSHDHLSRFERGESFCYRMYPQGCPAAPVDPWAFTSLGEVVNQFAGTGPLRPPRIRLLDLRNHLAHYHYVGWAAVSELVSIRQLLRM